jgi:hypothetical protein
MQPEFFTTKHAKAMKSGKYYYKSAIRIDVTFSFLRELRGSRVCSYFGCGFAAPGEMTPPFLLGGFAVEQ